MVWCSLPTAAMAATLPCPRGNARSRRRDNVTTGQEPLFQIAKSPRKGCKKESSEQPRCVASQRCRAAVAIVWQREKRRSERELVPATPHRASCPLHRHLMMPCHITSTTTKQCLSSCTMSRAQDSHADSTDEPASPTLKGHGRQAGPRAAIKGGRQCIQRGLLSDMLLVG